MAFYCCGGYTSDENFEKTRVVKARDRKTGEITALKRFAKGAPEALTEAEIWRRVYPELYIDFKEDGDYVYLAHKWIEGRTFYDVAASGDMDPLEITEKTAEALSAFHSRAGVPAGDLKPENVIIGETGVWLIDFESSAEGKQGENIGGRKTLCFASRAFTAPEVYHGECTKASDVYSLGMMFIFAKSGKTSFECLDDMPEGEREFCLKCTAKIPSDRYADGEEALCAVKTLAENKKSNKEDVKAQTGPAASGKIYDTSIKVENMNVTASRINYGIAAEPEQKFAEKRRENTARDSKIWEFPSNRASYRRLAIYIPGNITLAAEMAYLSASMYDMETVLFDINDYDVDKVKYHLPLGDAKASAGDTADALSPDHWKANGKIKTCTLCEKLDVAMSGILEDSEMNGLGARNIMVWCYSNYDIAVFSDASRLNADMSLELMRYSDYVLVPVCGDADSIDAETMFYRKYFKETKIPLNKLRFVAWEYSEKRSVDHEAMVMTLGKDQYAGTISYDGKRHSTGNIFGEMYCGMISPKIRSQYSELLTGLLFGKTKSA